MMVLERSPKDLQKGFRCSACGAQVPPTAELETKCPKCQQTYRAYGPELPLTREDCEWQA